MAIPPFLVSRITRKLSSRFALTRIEKREFVEKSESIWKPFELPTNVVAFKERIFFESHLTSEVNPIKEIGRLEKKVLLLLYSEKVLHFNLAHNYSIAQITFKNDTVNKKVFLRLSFFYRMTPTLVVSS